MGNGQKAHEVGWVGLCGAGRRAVYRQLVRAAASSLALATLCVRVCPCVCERVSGILLSIFCHQARLSYIMLSKCF